MSCAIVQEFAFSLPADSGLLRASVLAGEPIDQAEVLSLASLAQSLFVTATIESRQLGDIAKCHQFWAEVVQLFDELTRTWVDVTSGDPNIRWLRGQLEHFRDLAADRVEIYSEGWDRRRYVKRKAADSLA